MRAVGQAWRRLELGWRASLRRLPFFTQRTALLLVGVLVASLAMLGGRGRARRRGGDRPGGPRDAAPRRPRPPRPPSPPGPLDPVSDLLGPVVSTLLP